MAQIIDVLGIQPKSNSEALFRRGLEFLGLKKLGRKSRSYLGTVLSDHMGVSSGSHPGGPQSANDPQSAIGHGTNIHENSAELHAAISWLRNNPGKHAAHEIIREVGLDYTTWQLVRDLMKLDPAIRVSGQKRGTRYEWVGGA